MPLAGSSRRHKKRQSPLYAGLGAFSRQYSSTIGVWCATACVTMRSDQVFALIDYKSFYASCKRVFRPDWALPPIVVLSNNDGCVIALSYDAKGLIFIR